MCYGEGASIYSVIYFILFVLVDSESVRQLFVNLYSDCRWPVSYPINLLCTHFTHIRACCCVFVFATEVTLLLPVAGEHANQWVGEQATVPLYVARQPAEGGHAVSGRFSTYFTSVQLLSYWCLVTLAPGEECEGHAFGSVCLYVHVTPKLSLQLTWIFYVRSIVPVVRSSSKMIRIGIYYRILHHW